MTTGVTTVLGWLDDPRDDSGIDFATGRAEWEHWSYERLARRIHQVAAGLQDVGVAERAVVMLTARTGPEFIASLFGTMLAGAVPAPVAPPSAFGAPDTYRTHLERLIGTAQPFVLLSDEPANPAQEEAAAGTAFGEPLDVRTLTTLSAPRTVPPAQLALLQFTSGSTTTPRGVRVPFSALGANVDAIIEWTNAHPQTRSAHWLPYFHDMGLIGGLLTPVSRQTPLWSMRPEQFLRSPVRYLSLFGSSGAQVGSMANFGMEYILRRVRPDQLEGLDFSGVTALILGSERIDPEVLARFHRLLAPFGLREEALSPAYGLAEATLAVTGVRLDRKPVTSLPARSGTSDLAPAVPVVGCGTPLAGVTVEVVGDDGRPLPDGEIGLIEVGGASVADGYLGDGGDAFSGRRLRTGDAGFRRDGQLFVIGRFGDSVKIRGRMVFAEDLESQVREAAGLGSLPIVLLGLHRGDEPMAVALLRRPDRDRAGAVVEALRTRVDGASAVVLSVGDRVTERTTSGKPRRRRMWRRMMTGDLPGEVLADTRASTPEATASDGAR